MRGFSCSCGPLSGAERVENVLGHAAVSRAGHDSGKIYLVVGVVDPGERGELLLLADGSSRRVSNPKAKKPKHLTVLKYRSADAADLLLAGKLPDDSIVVRSLKEAVRNLGLQI